ncbi:N-acetyltransferase family protein [Capilliphycus salinus ALCB114379]|uniref:GNAT family N-acetyltransferase n=1 Tax=Capilliphycus salinus TaxID=2768948 RepID=UPI0039A51D7A
MTPTYKFNFRPAIPEDWEAIIDIHNSLVTRDKNVLNYHGFLLAKTTEKEIQDNIDKQTQYFVAVEQYLEKNPVFKHQIKPTPSHQQKTGFPNQNTTNFTNNIRGFLALSKPKITPEFLNQIIWKDDSYRNQILGERHLYIKIIATHPNHRGKGVAQFMYKSLYETFPNSFLSAFIVNKPISNHRSIIFHEKQGFYPVGTLKLESFLDFKNYESLLMVKQI